MTAIRNAFTVDVEDYFQVSALAPYIARADWDRIECRVERNVDRILALLDASGNRATFFTLGWIAQRHPAMVQRIARAGHEIASHGSAHLRATDQSPVDFLDDISRAKKLLEDITGVEVRGYRAPSFSIGHANPWALDCVAEAGYRYSSSIYPVKHDHYGMPDAPRFPFASRDGLMEVPVTTVRVGSRNLPAGGGGYFRLLPYVASRWLLQQVNRRDGRPAMFYCHPWEIDAAQPRIAGVDAKSRFRHYINLDRTEVRLARLMRDFRWGRMDEVFPEIARAT
ncbi:XrtA system polysaccharide deacetylase [Methyloversatilis sp. XJ19-13]|uniref:XrtA system polysaccharide deacetylase n=1 Tax=Methyloversatilis sp. XJ19-13 TaxID=2963430 RepID=UPI0035941A71